MCPRKYHYLQHTNLVLHETRVTMNVMKTRLRNVTVTMEEGVAR